LTHCSDCGLADPPDIHTCQQYEDRIRAEREAMTTQQIINEFEQRLQELERRVAALSIAYAQNRPWSMR